MLKGTKCSEKIRIKMSKAKKGKNHPMYGKHHTEKTKRKMSEATKGKIFTKEHCRNISKALKGRKLSEEHRKKVSESLKGKHRNFSEEHKRNISESSKGKILSEEHKRKISENHIGMKGKKHSKETKMKIVQSLANYWKENLSSIEIAIHKILDSLNIKYRIQFPIKNWLIDIYIPNKNLIIECNGNYWHSFPERIKRDKRLEDYAKENGYKLIWLWENDIEKDAKSALMKGFKDVS